MQRFALGLVGLLSLKSEHELHDVKPTRESRESDSGRYLPGFFRDLTNKTSLKILSTQQQQHSC